MPEKRPRNGAVIATRIGPGATPNPAARMDHCHTLVRNRMLDKNIAVKAVPKASAAALAHLKFEDWKRLRSSTGAEVRGLVQDEQSQYQSAAQ